MDTVKVLYKGGMEVKRDKQLVFSLHSAPMQLKPQWHN